MNHKRRRPKNRRAGCLFCKPWKANGQRKDRATVARAKASAEAQMQEVAR